MILKEGETLQPLGNGISVIVSKEHSFNTDTILLANFALPIKNKNVIELGCGCGAISLILLRNNQQFNITAVEIQQNACEMFNRSIEYNNLQDKIKLINSDMNDLKDKVKFNSFDFVICNPPYKPKGTGILNNNASKITARHETECSLEDVIKVSKKLLKFSGKLFLCQRPERLCDVLNSMRRENIEPKRLRFVQQRVEKAPKLFLIEGRLGGKHGGLNVLPNLIIEDENGQFSDEMKKIYGSYYTDNKKR